MTTPRRPALELEPLHARILPSATPLPAPSLPPAAVAPSAAIHLLDGHGHGAYTADRIISDAGPEYRLTGTANLAGIGRVQVTGSLHGVGFIAQGRAGGTLTFSNGKGSVTVQLTGPAQPGFSALPPRWDYKVVASTGALAHLSTSGTLQLVLQALPNGNLQTPPHGTFTLTVGTPTPPGSL